MNHQKCRLDTQTFRITNKSEHFVAEITQNQAEADWLLAQLSTQSRSMIDSDWKMFVQSPFEYPLPIPKEYAARFKPAGYNRNCIYLSEDQLSSIFEAAFYFYRGRANLKDQSHKSQQRILLGISIATNNAIDTCNYSAINLNRLTNKNDYSPSQDFVNKIKINFDAIRFPSCRKSGGYNIATYEQELFKKHTLVTQPAWFSSEKGTIKVIILNDALAYKIKWSDVS